MARIAVAPKGPGTVYCKPCDKRVNRLAVYRTTSGKVCRACLPNTDTSTATAVSRSPVIVADAESVGPVKNADGSPSAVTVAMLTGRSMRLPPPTTCGGLPGTSDVTCHRLPRHSGEHRTTLQRRGKVA